jgi:hypothetical protein
LGWSDDGTTLYCVYSVVTRYFPGYNSRDIFIQYSLNEGQTWSNPFRVTNTPNIDETYPSISYWNKGSSGQPYDINITYMKDPVLAHLHSAAQLLLQGIARYTENLQAFPDWNSE